MHAVQCVRDLEMDQALWITWYDLPEQARDAHLAWLHVTHMPRLVQGPGMLWAAHYASEAQQVHTAKQKQRRYPPPGTVPAGHRYILLVGGESIHAFADPTPKQFEARLPDAERRILAQRADAMANLMIEYARIEGPEAGCREAGKAPGPCIQLGSYVFDGDEDELLAWYTQWRLPSMTTMPGCIAVRKLASVAGWAKHAILHEFTSVAARNENFVNNEARNHPEQARWSEKVTGQVIHAPGSPNVAHRLASVVAA
jgi:hypothetical protein